MEKIQHIRSGGGREADSQEKNSAAPCLGALRYRVRVCADSARGMVDGWVAGALAPGKAVYGRRYEEQKVTSCCPGLGRTEEGPAPVLLGAGQGSDGVARDEVYLSPVRVPGLRWRSEVDVFWPRAPHWWRPDVVVGLSLMEVLRSRDSKVVSQWAVEERLRSERSSFLQLCMYGSGDPDDGRMGYTFCVPVVAPSCGVEC
ncbi:unnamed protein product [Boreogadus saida]